MRLMIDAPGALTTVQDLGRTGVAHLGFCTCGAMDLTSMQIANRLVGDPGRGRLCPHIKWKTH